MREPQRDWRTHEMLGFVPHPSLQFLSLDAESQSLAQLGDFIGKPISLQVENQYSQEQYDIMLM